MDTLSAFAMGEANRGNEPMVFDWDLAASLIANGRVVNAEAGLRDDWEYTGGAIFSEGQPHPEDKTYIYLASTWAVPELVLDGAAPIPCYRMASEVPGWDAHTYWPQSARDILDGPKAIEN